MLAQNRLYVGALAITLVLAGCSTPQFVHKNSGITTSTDSIAVEDTFAPQGYSVLQDAVSDLNGDGLDDEAVIYKSKDEDNPDVDASTNDFPPRILTILLGQKDGSYTQLLSNDRAVQCKTCGGVMGDPLQDMVIDTHGRLVVSYYGGSSWRWGATHTFAWKNEGLYLVEYTDYQLNSTLLMDETKTYNLETGDFDHSWGVPDDYKTNSELSKEDKQEIAKYDREPEHTKIPVKPLINLKDFDQATYQELILGH